MFSNILVGTDGSHTAAAAVALAVELARQNGATLHLVGAYKDPSTSVAVAHTGAVVVPDPTLGDTTKAACEELLTDTANRIDGITVERHVVCGPPADMILQVARGIGADLIVVGSKGMKGARRILGSVPNSVAHAAPCHVLIAKTA